MLIGGMQKTSLMDYPGKISTIIFTIGCNLRCNYCHNPHLFETKNVIAEKEVFGFLEKRKKYLDAVVISGGEPTLQKDLIDFIKKIKTMGFFVKLDTNGTHPEVIENLIRNNLIDYIAMDVKAPVGSYSKIMDCVVDEKSIKKSIDIVMNSGIDYEFRTTLYPKLNQEDFRRLFESIKGAKRLYLQQYEPKNAYKKEEIKPYEKNQLIELLNLAKTYVQKAELRGIEN